MYNDRKTVIGGRCNGNIMRLEFDGGGVIVEGVDDNIKRYCNTRRGRPGSYPANPTMTQKKSFVPVDCIVM